MWLVFKSGIVLFVSWRFRFWNDIDIDVENWVMEVLVIDYENDFLLMCLYFEIEFWEGKLEFGEIIFVKFIYRVDVEGWYDFFVIF